MPLYEVDVYETRVVRVRYLVAAKGPGLAREYALLGRAEFEKDIKVEDVINREVETGPHEIEFSEGNDD